MANDLFIRYQQLAKDAELKRGTKESARWFAEQVRKGPKINNLEKVTKDLKSTKIEPGKMFIYSYDPKLKESLPFYDTNPIVIILDMTRDGWYGANLHYLPPTMRAVLLAEVNKGKRSGAQIVRALEGNPVTKFCLKRYLASHVVSKPKVVSRADWEIAIQLPFESFQKAAMKDIWKRARRR